MKLISFIRANWLVDPWNVMINKLFLMTSLRKVYFLAGSQLLSEDSEQCFLNPSYLGHSRLKSFAIPFKNWVLSLDGTIGPQQNSKVRAQSPLPKVFSLIWKLF
jgi:hypothetical protein